MDPEQKLDQDESEVLCRGVVWRSGRVAVLDGVDFRLGKGASVALLGESGSGKSTLLRIIAGIQIPQQGEVLIAGRVATQGKRILIPPPKRGVAMLFQDLALWPNLTVAGNVALGLAGQGLSKQVIRSRVREVLELCGISELAERLPGTLSGGQQQRAALARALAARPKLLLLDEPFGGLDLVTKLSVTEQVVKLRSALGFAMILVTHDPIDAGRMCEALAVLEGGRIVDQVALREAEGRVRTKLARVFCKQLSRAVHLD